MVRDTSSLVAGDALPARSFGPITRSVLALFAGGSADHNPIHIDIDFARQAGSPDVFAHGMLSMAYLMRYTQEFVSLPDIVSSSVRFLAITPVNSTVTFAGVVEQVDVRTISLALSACTHEGVETVRASVVARRNIVG